MGVIKRGLLGGFSGKVANLVGSSWKGIAVVKSLPLSVSNPNTAAQQTQRGKLSGVVIVAKLILATVIKPYWDRFAQQMSGYNAFVSANIANFTGDVLTTPTEFILSQGTVTAPHIGSVTVNPDSANIVVATIDNSGTGDALATDDMMFYAYDEDSQTFAVAAVGKKRNAAGNVTLVMPVNMSETANVYVYGCAKRADGSKASGTVYLLGEPS
jgi:hypothetical protein